MANSAYRFIGHASSPFTIPTVSGENETFSNDGTSVAGFSTTGGTLTPTAGVVRISQTTSTTAVVSTIAMTVPNAGKDWIFYGRCKARQSTDDAFHIRVKSSGSARAMVALNFNTTTSTRVAGNISIQARNSSAVDTNALLVTGWDTVNDWVDFALLQDTKFNSLNLYLKRSYTVGSETQNRWKLAGRISMQTFDPVEMELVLLGGASVPAGQWGDWDHFYLCAPNFISHGDSGPKGSPFHSNAVADALNDDTNTWSHWAPLQIDTLINTLIVNKGVGGEDSSQIESRTTADIVNNTPQLVFLHCSNNDFQSGSPIADATRLANIQGTVDLIVGGGAQCVVCNSSYSSAYNTTYVPARRDYYRDWWQNYRGQLTDVDALIDIAFPTLSWDGFQAASLTASDNAHRNQLGAAEVGRFILNGGS